jgi:hypothetical protein
MQLGRWRHTTILAVAWLLLAATCVRGRQSGSCANAASSGVVRAASRALSVYSTGFFRM